MRAHGGGPKTWTQEDMELALDALRNHNMSLTKVCFFFNIIILKSNIIFTKPFDTK